MFFGINLTVFGMNSWHVKLFIIIYLFALKFILNTDTFGVFILHLKKQDSDKTVHKKE